MTSFSELVASRKAWIEDHLKPWCRNAALKDLRLAAEAWPDIAGKVDPEKTLWFWAWSRFPDLVQSELMGIDETAEISVSLRDGRTLTGFPDARQSLHGSLVLIRRDPDKPRQFNAEGPFRLDEILSVERVGHSDARRDG